MTLIGLTGGIGMGKSTAAGLLRRRGLPVVDTDALARDLVAPGSAALNEIVAAFGAEMVDSAGALNRPRLADRVFSDETARRKLESILHPRIRAAWQEAAAQWRAERRSAGIVVIPLLFETGAEKELDLSACVACSMESQRARLQARGYTSVQIERRAKAQWPVRMKMDKCDFVLWAEGEIRVLDAQLGRMLSNLATSPVLR
ncbi:MAG TPA: dephospho-CoA kinase [Verrucomicrobiae bacterium]|nr:dephospho-CoA kinase [Verrucomicrobiae bacterium]